MIDIQNEPQLKTQPIRPSIVLQEFISRPEFGLLIVLILEVIVFSALRPAFLSPDNISNFLAFTPELGIIALGMTMVMTAGEFDLSVGSVFGFAPVVMWSLYNTNHWPFELGLAVAMLLAVVIGFASGWLVPKLKISSFLVRLGMLLIVRGIALYITAGFPQGTWEAASPIMQYIVGEIVIGPFRIYASLIWFLVLAAILAYVLTQSKAGNW